MEQQNPDEIVDTMLAQRDDPIEPQNLAPAQIVDNNLAQTVVNVANPGEAYVGPLNMFAVIARERAKSAHKRQAKVEKTRRLKEMTALLARKKKAIKKKTQKVNSLNFDGNCFDYQKSL